MTSCRNWLAAEGVSNSRRLIRSNGEARRNGSFSEPWYRYAVPVTRWGLTSSGWKRREALLTAVGAPLTPIAAVVALTSSDRWIRLVASCVTVGALICSVAGLTLRYMAHRSEGRRNVPSWTHCCPRRFLMSARLIPRRSVSTGPPQRRSARLAMFPIFREMSTQPSAQPSTQHSIGHGEWFIVLDGLAKTGKSRTLLEALRAAGRSESLSIMAPRGADQVSELVKQASRAHRAPGRMVLWLNDIEQRITEGLSYADLLAWRGRYPSGLIVGTHGGKTPEAAAELGPARLASLVGALLNHAKTLPLAQTSAGELAQLPSALVSGNPR